MKTITSIFLSFIACLSTIAQIDHSQDLYKTLKTNDSLLFDVGFNNCDMQQFENLISEDFEFYHDQGGITNSKAAFIASIKENICQLSYKPKRQLIEGLKK